MWHQLAYDAARLALNLALVLAFLWVVSSILGRNWRQLSRFLGRALKAELAETPGWLDMSLCVLFAACVYVPTISEQIFAALRIGHLSSDQRLLNSDLRAVLMTWVVTFSLAFVGFMSRRP